MSEIEELHGRIAAAMDRIGAGLGALEQRIEETATRNSAERTATSLARLELVGTDEFETATRYENTRAQLETLRAAAARPDCSVATLARALSLTAPAGHGRCAPLVARGFVALDGPPRPFPALRSELAPLIARWP